MVDFPEQKDKLPLITGERLLLIEVVAEVLAEHPFAFVTVTVKVAAVFTLIVCEVAPVDHK